VANGGEKERRNIRFSLKLVARTVEAVWKQNIVEVIEAGIN
jgi:hypothetical protein